jgi:hypothetical protein
MKNFLYAVLAENGTPSSKRFITFLLLLLWIFAFVYNLVTGKTASETYTTQHYLMLTTGLGLIFGSNVLDTIKSIKVTQSNNNAQVGASSPTPPASPAPVTTNIIS